jgi:hypothetical protein
MMSRSRRFVNLVDSGMSHEALYPSKYCPRCKWQLSYLDDYDVYICSHCGFGLPDELLDNQLPPPPPLSPEERQQRRSSKKNKDADDSPALTGTRNESLSPSSNTQDDNDIAIVSKPSRTKERKKDPYEFLKKDDVWLAEKGLTLVSDAIDIPGGDAITTSSDELRQDRDRKRGRPQW